MATTTKTIQTRIKNRFDTLDNWQGTGVTLLPGEIALVSVTTQQIDKVTGDVVNVPAVLMKVGESDGKGGTKAFESLPWVSALAADVYDWAKESDAGNVVVKYNKGTEENQSWQSTTLLDIFKNLEDARANISALTTNKLNDISMSTDGTQGVVKVIEKDGVGGLKATKSLVATTDIADKAVTTAKIEDANITTAKIANSAITNAKVADDISASKIVYSGSGDNKVTVASQLGEVTAQIAGILTKFSVNPASATAEGVVQGITYDNTTGKFAVSYGTVQTADIANSAITTAKLANESVTTDKLAKGAVTNEKVASDISSDKITIQNTEDTLTEKLISIDSYIAAINGTLSKGIIFRGEVKAAPVGNTYTLVDTTDAKSAYVGDMVLFGEKEYVYVAENTWKELGDLSRVTTLETWRNKLQIQDAPVTNEFVTAVSIAEDGTVSISREQPTSADISHDGTSTVKTELEAINAQLADKADAGHTHPAYEKNAFSKITVANSGGGTNDVSIDADTVTDTVTFVGSNLTITGDATNDKITFSVDDAATSTAGIVKLSDAVDSNSNAATGKTAATPKAVKTAYDAALAAAADAAGRAPGDHGHGNIAKDGTITSTEVDEADGVIVYDSDNKIQRATAAQARSIIGAAESGHIHDNRYTRYDAAQTLSDTQKDQARANIGAAESGHIHSDYAADISAINDSYVKFVPDSATDDTKGKLYVGKLDTTHVIIFDCGGAADLE